jgi:hypothetical protein
MRLPSARDLISNNAQIEASTPDGDKSYLIDSQATQVIKRQDYDATKDLLNQQVESATRNAPDKGDASDPNTVAGSTTSITTTAVLRPSETIRASMAGDIVQGAISVRARGGKGGGSGGGADLACMARPPACMARRPAWRARRRSGRGRSEGCVVWEGNQLCSPSLWLVKEMQCKALRMACTHQTSHVAPLPQLLRSKLPPSLNPSSVPPFLPPYLPI